MTNVYSHLSIPDVILCESQLVLDERGLFTEVFVNQEFQEASGVNFQVAQSNFSKSKKGVLRGIHFSIAKQGQAKLITCLNGKLLDIAVDLRPKSKYFRKYTSVELSAENGRTLLIPAGFGHAFLALDEGTIMSYLLSSRYSPEEEFSINPYDTEIGIVWPSGPHIQSKRDQEAPRLQQLFLAGILEGVAGG